MSGRSNYVRSMFMNKLSAVLDLQYNTGNAAVHQKYNAVLMEIYIPWLYNIINIYNDKPRILIFGRVCYP